MLKREGQGDVANFHIAGDSVAARRPSRLDRTWRFIVTGPGDARSAWLSSIGQGFVVAAVEMSQSEVEDLGLDVLGAGRVDGFSQLLDKQVDELGAGPLEVLAEGLGRDRRVRVVSLSFSAISSMDALG